MPSTSQSADAKSAPQIETSDSAPHKFISAHLDAKMSTPRNSRHTASPAHTHSLARTTRGHHAIRTLFITLLLLLLLVLGINYFPTDSSFASASITGGSEPCTCLQPGTFCPSGPHAKFGVSGNCPSSHNAYICDSSAATSPPTSWIFSSLAPFSSFIASIWTHHTTTPPPPPPPPPPYLDPLRTCLPGETCTTNRSPLSYPRGHLAREVKCREDEYCAFGPLGFERGREVDCVFVEGGKRTCKWSSVRILEGEGWDVGCVGVGT